MSQSEKERFSNLITTTKHIENAKSVFKLEY
jgi:hypothetical protein